MALADSPLLRSSPGFVCAVLGAGLAPWLASGHAIGGLVVAAYLGFVFLPFWLLDALLVQPLVGRRLHPLALLAIEGFCLLAYRMALQWRGFTEGSPDDQAVLTARLLTGTVVFFTLYSGFEALFGLRRRRRETSFLDKYRS